MVVVEGVVPVLSVIIDMVDDEVGEDRGSDGVHAVLTAASLTDDTLELLFFLDASSSVPTTASASVAVPLNTCSCGCGSDDDDDDGMGLPS